MTISSRVAAHLYQEALALRARLDAMQSPGLFIPHVAAAGLSRAADSAVREFLSANRRRLQQAIGEYASWLQRSAAARSGADAQKRMAILRLEVTNTLSRYDLFADVLTQRSEHRVGTWLAGLEVVAMDALDIRDQAEAAPPPPVVCYLDRGAGAAIRRARTRLEGGVLNPVALVQIPRERMIGSGVGSSLVHEVGHQGAALHELNPSLDRTLDALQGTGDGAWRWWRSWLSEVIADFWAVARIGPAALLGMLTVLSLPRPFVYRAAPQDPHPFPWIRFRLCCAVAQELFPHPQWRSLDRLWRELYPLGAAGDTEQRVMRQLSGTLRALARLLAEHRPPLLEGASLREALLRPAMTPEALSATLETRSPWIHAPPCRAIALLGQAKLENRLSAAVESAELERLFTRWALDRSGTDKSAHGHLAA